MIISFGWTWPAFVTRHKTVTRRNWQPDYASRFAVGDLFQAYDKSPRFNGRQIGIGRILEPIVVEGTSQMPDDDYEGEGFAFLSEHPYLLPVGAKKNAWCKDNCSHESFADWQRADDQLYVIRFEIVEVVSSVALEVAKRMANEGVRP